MKINLIIILFLYLKVLSICSLPPKKDSHKASKLTLIGKSTECNEDVRRLCSHTKKSDDLTLLNCLQDNEEVLKEISTKCQHFLWSYKRNLTTSDYLDKLTNKKCSSSLDKIDECKNAQFGHQVPCLLDYKDKISDPVCHRFLNKVGIIVFSDYHLIYKFIDKCDKDITKFKCGRLRIGNEVDPDDEKETKESLVDYVTSQADTIDCLVNSILNISKTCQHEILRLSELQSDDYHLNRKLYMACREDRDTLCANVDSGDGRVYSCLMKHKFDDRISKKCQDQLTKKQKIESMDAKADYSLFSHCKNDIEKYECKIENSESAEEVWQMSAILLCLEEVVHRGRNINPNCKAELTQRRVEMLEDLKVSPEVVVACIDDVKSNCESAGRQPGAVLHCLIGLNAADENNPKGKLSGNCRVALTHLLKVANPTEDIILLDPTIRKSCTSSLRNLCGDTATKDQAFQCLIENLDNPDMAPGCHKDLSNLLSFVAYDFRIDSAVESACHQDAVKLCNGPKTYNETLKRTDNERRLEYYCMYEHYKNDRIKMDLSAAQGSSHFNRSLSVECSTEIFRLIKAQASQIQLDPIVFESCLPDLSKFCKSKQHKGREHECLQEKFDELQTLCQKAIIDFSQMEDADVRLNRQLTEACMPMTKLFCKNKSPEDLLNCLILHKRHPDMIQSCQAAIEHVQIISLEEYKIDHRFASFCETEIKRYCPNELKGIPNDRGNKIISKIAIVSCLSKTVVSKLIEGEEHPLSKMCRRQFSFELLQRSDSVTLDRNLLQDCKADIEKHCKDAAPDKVSTCLRKHQDDLEEQCHRRIFQRERMEALDANFDGRLKRVCSQMIKEHCRDISGRNLFQCLHRRIQEPEFDEDCRKLIYLRLERRMHDIRLNPGLLRDCEHDIKAHCGKADIKHLEPSNGIEFEGIIINCLKEVFTNNTYQLQSSCRQRILKIMVEANAYLRLDPVLRKKCQPEIQEYCKREFENEFDTSIGTVHDCLKAAFIKRKSFSRECQHEIYRLLNEGRADVHVDHQLFEACEDAIIKLCRNEEFGKGRKMSCLLQFADDEKGSKLLDSRCLEMIRDRREMWSFAANIEPQSMQDLLIQVNQSSMRTSTAAAVLLRLCRAIFDDCAASSHQNDDLRGQATAEHAYQCSAWRQARQSRANHSGKRACTSRFKYGRIGDRF